MHDQDNELDPIWEQNFQTHDISKWSEEEILDETRLVEEDITIPPMISDDYEVVRIWKR